MIYTGDSHRVIDLDPDVVRGLGANAGYQRRLINHERLDILVLHLPDRRDGIAMPGCGVDRDGWKQRLGHRHAVWHECDGIRARRDVEPAAETANTDILL